MATDIGTRIKRARERKRWSQQRLADALHVDRKTVDNWENGRTKPRSSIGALEDVLGTSLSDEEPAPSIPQSLLSAIMETEGLSDEDRVAVIAAIDKTLTKGHGAAAPSAPGAAAARHRPAS